MRKRIEEKCERERERELFSFGSVCCCLTQGKWGVSGVRKTEKVRGGR